MSDYYNNKRNYRNYKKKRRTKGEKIGFYTAFSVCMIAVCLAVYSTYNTLTESEVSVSNTKTSEAVQVNEPVTGVTETIAVPQIEFEVPTVVAETERATIPSTQMPTRDMTALETMLSTNLTLEYPLSTVNIIREYSEKSVYFKTLNVWKPHKGADFAGNIGDDVTAMSDGAVTKISEDKMLGKTVEISHNDAVVKYCGLGDIKVSKGDSIKVGDVIGNIGAVPCEASDESHVHIEVKVNGKNADPLSFINNNE